ncbi:MAG: hypothetical protein P4L83_14085 [Nevskia sp.]|nr:hypothetical protein [Nevskia sp.]
MRRLRLIAAIALLCVPALALAWGRVAVGIGIGGPVYYGSPYYYPWP